MEKMTLAGGTEYLTMQYELQRNYTDGHTFIQTSLPDQFHSHWLLLDLQNVFTLSYIVMYRGWR
jgi:hypothetical protein